MSRNLVGALAALGVLYFSFAAAPAAEAANGYYRWPTVSGDTVIVAAEGDLWRGSVAGGEAYRLTTHEDEESEPTLSPDGSRIAFVASYDSAPEVYVMPARGGAPKQMSFDGGGVSVRGWSPDGRIVYVSTAAIGKPFGRVLRLVNPDTLAEEELPLADTEDATFSADGSVVFFTRFGISMTGDNVKRYRGGRMAQLWRYRIGQNAEATRLAADFAAPIRYPMWAAGRVYFVSDKSGAANIWSMNEDGGDLVQHTTFSDWDVRAPRLHGGVIAFQLGADIHVYDIAARSERIVALSLIGDLDGRRERWLGKPLDYLTSAQFAPKGDRVALTARGQVALASPGPLRRVEFAAPGEARARSAVVSGDGKWVYAILDQRERGEIWRYPLDGRGEAVRLTTDAGAYRWRLYPSPYGKYLAHDDKMARLWIYNLDSGQNRLIETADGASNDAYSNFSWSPGNRYLAYARTDARGIGRVVLVDLETSRREVVTSGKYESYSPAFSRDGKWLYFLSDRQFQPTPGAPWGDRNMGPHFDRRAKIYALALDPSARFPFLPKDELAPDDAEKSGGKKEDSGKTKDIAVAWEGLSDRIYEAPAPSGDYANLDANNEFLFVIDGDFRERSLKSLKIDAAKPKMETFAEKVRGYALSADGKKLFYALDGDGREGEMFIVDAGAKAPGDASDGKLRTADWKIAVDPSREWRQIFLDAWRMHRDFSFDPTMRGLDWNRVRAKHEPLVERVGHRGELNDLLGQMTSELGILHSQVRATDLPTDGEKGVAAALGAIFAPGGGGMRVSRVYRSEAELLDERPPLARPGVDIRAGDIILAVNGEAVASKADLYRRLQHRAGQQVALDVKRGSEPVRKVVVEPAPIERDRLFLYKDWIEEERGAVAASGANIGYLHLRAMGPGDIASFARDFYEHFDKSGLIIDARGNRGGNIESWIIATLQRRAWAFWQQGARPWPYTNMQQAFRGHVAVLIDEGTYSDGETFAAGVKALGLGPLIGARTAGAGIWLSDRNRLADNGIARIAESAQFGLDGRWLIEGEGVSPDIEVANPPYAAYRGDDRQLQAAIDYLKRKIADEPVPTLKGGGIPPVGENGRDVSPLPQRQ